MNDYLIKDLMCVNRGSSPRPILDYLSDFGYRWLKISDFKIYDKYVYETKEFIKESGLKNTKHLPSGTLILTNSATPGIPIFLGKDMCLHDGFLYFTNINEEIINKNYLYYWFIYNRNLIVNQANGSVFKNLKKEIVENFKIEVPDYNIQLKTIRILDNINNKINQNNEINNNLYDLSNSIYKQWFEKYDFPNFNGRYKDSELGMIPENWDIGYFDDSILTKIIKSGVKKFEGLKKYVATADVSGTNITSYEKIKYDNKPSRANMTPIISSIWFAKMENSVKNILVDSYMSDILDNYIFSTGFMGIECFNNSLYYMWNLINDDKFLLEKNSLSTGTLMAGISNSTIKKYKYLIPDNKTLELFNKIQIDINKEIYNNNVENEQLSQLRDTLLSKLMNGEIDLDNIEI